MPNILLQPILPILLMLTFTFALVVNDFLDFRPGRYLFKPLPAAFGLRNPSPFCLEIEMALTHLNIDFDIETVADPRKAPKGKMPWLVDGEVIPDSELILEHLDKKTNGGLFGGLSAQELAIGTAFTRLAEDHLFWIMVAARSLSKIFRKYSARGNFNDKAILGFSEPAGYRMCRATAWGTG